MLPDMLDFALTVLSHPQFQNNCHPAWVKYFEQQREKLKMQGKPWTSPNMEGKNGSRAPQRA
eukprot:143884-Rhodomonas_salina.5